MSVGTEIVRVLHVDPDRRVREGVASYLEDNRDDLTVESTAAAGAGLDRIADDRIDCVVSAYEMSGLDGIEFLEAVRSTNPSLPFIMYADGGSEAIASDATVAGVTDYLPAEGDPDRHSRLADRIDAAVPEGRAQDSDRRLRQLADTTDSVLYTYSVEVNELVFVNDAYEDVFGGSIQRLRSDPTAFLETVHPEDRNRVREAMARVYDGETVGIEFRVGPDEEYDRWVRGRGTPVIDGTGDIARVSGVVTDITDRKELQQKLETKTNRLEAAQHVARVGSWTWNVDEDDIAWSDETYRIFGRDPDDAESPTFEDWFETVHPDDREAVRAELDEAMATGSFSPFEHRLRQPDGTVRWVRSRGEIEHEDGDIVRVNGTVTDITEPKVRENRIEEQRELYETVLAQSANGVAIVQDAEVVFVDPTMAELTGLSESELLGRPVTELVAPEYRDTVDRWHADRIDCEGPPRQYEIEIPTSSGGRRIIDLSVSRIQYRGEPAVLATFNDITDRRQHQRRLEAVFDNTYQFTGLMETDGTLVEANQTALSFGDLDREDVVGEKVWETPWFRTNKETRQVTKRAVERASQGEFFRDEVRVQGSVREAVIDFSVRPLRNDDGEIEMLIPEGRDVTELQRQREHLSVLQRYLRHNIRNDLNVVQGFARQLVEELDDPAQVESAETIREYATELSSSAELVKELSEGLLENDGETEPVGVEAAVGTALETVEGDGEQISGVDVTPDIAVDADDRFGRVLGELLDALLEHADPEGKIRINVYRSNGTVHLTLACRDCAIPPTELSAFDAADDRSATHHPNGMRLWAAKTVLESYGGAVNYRVPADDPTLIHLALPAA